MTKKLRLTKNVIYSGCAGYVVVWDFEEGYICAPNLFLLSMYMVYLLSKGGAAGASKQCSGCKGRGVKVVIRQLGPGMIQQMQTHCPDCNGEGLFVICCLWVCL